EELRRAAGGRRRVLRRAERATRQGGRHRESETRDRAQRLMEAAATGKSIRPPLDSDSQTFDQLAEFFASNRPLAPVWAELPMREPRLSELEADVRTGRYGPALAAEKPLTSDELKDPQVRRAHAERARLGLELFAQVEAILGPRAENPDPIVRSRKAK